MGTVQDVRPKVQTILVFGIRPSFGSSFDILYVYVCHFSLISDQIRLD